VYTCVILKVALQYQLTLLCLQVHLCNFSIFLTARNPTYLLSK